MEKNKKIIFPFLFLAWTIIFAHSIIPHHHSSNDLNANASIHFNNFTENSKIHDCDHDCHIFTCHFQVKILTQGSIDQVFTVNAEDSFINNQTLINETYPCFYSGMISEQIPKSKFLRGPPQRIIS